MHSTQLITWLVIVPLVTIVVAVALRSKKKRKKMTDVYKDLISDNHLEVSEEQILYDKILAVDNKKKVFVFLHNHVSPVYNLIHLNGLSGCKVEKKGIVLPTKLDGKQLSELYVQEVYLSLLTADSVFTNLLIYSELLDGQQEYINLIRIADEWQQRLDALIKS